MTTRSKKVVPGFTVVELLIVLTTISMLLGILLPAVEAAPREAARRTRCQSNLHQIGIAFEHFVQIQGSRGKYPNAIAFPSFDAATHGPSLPVVLADFTEDNSSVWLCPSDQASVTDELRGDSFIKSTGYLRYFDRNRTSYEYQSLAANRTREQLCISRRSGIRQSSSRVWIVRDVKWFHGAADDEASRNYLYLDGHVSGVLHDERNP